MIRTAMLGSSVSSGVFSRRPRCGSGAFRWLLLASGLFLASPAAGAEPDTDQCIASDVQPESIDLDQPRDQLARQSDLVIPAGARIGQVRIVRRPIFDVSDPEQDNFLYRTLNALNTPTWESALRAQLVFNEGDPYDPALIAESERVLRQREYLTAAWVGATHVCGDEVEVSVLARDTWTLLPTVGGSRSGGENTTNTGLSDPNFLGSGKSLGVSYTKDPDRTETSVYFDDPNVLGSHWQSGFAYDDRSDGRGRSAYLERPFFSDSADWRFGLSGLDDVREQSRFVGAEAIADYRRSQEFVSVDVGWRLLERNDRQVRLLAGYRYDALEFERLPDEADLDLLPEDRTLSYPWIGFDYRENRFREMTNLTQLQRVEDVRDGFVWRTELGYSSPGLGATEDRVVLNVDFQDALLATATNYARYGISQSGNYRLDDDRFENLQGTLSLEYFHGGVVRWNSWYTNLSVTAAHNLTVDQQLLIGGENGLRGYPSDYQQGNRRALWTLERRFFPDWHPFKLFRLGGVLFTDVGRAWFDDGRNNGPDDGVLKDIGFGLRLASSRIEVQRMLHLDFAFPLDGDDSIDQVQILLRGRSSF
ncbi:BamA/TamA family outer membrane protein [Marinobacter sp. ATCH36]|uniref:BamA/TamA family outer membrane protein n=1 Tax=Marinobacter sp. ATCH36 TaxID=2945106 RepID=UPI0020204EB5|nr:BamA/TamA family outer membrane protein [Marinobacter sp. ATCH36]MCL7943753.1 BamA/TamA family outer membrane protein [Marinobacter sp. ATCH36]